MDKFARGRPAAPPRASAPRAVALALGCVLATACATSSPTAAVPDNRMVSIHGPSEPFTKLGRRTFPYPKERCFQAVLTTFKNTGHGVDRADAGSGLAISGKGTVYRAQVPVAGALVQRTNDTKLYVRVTASGTSCEVDVRRLRLWREATELENAREGWVNEQLRGFMTGVEQELFASE